MKNSQRVAFYEAAYDRIRNDILTEAPPSATISVGFPSKKRSGQNMTIGECAYDCIKDHGEGFGAENLITIHPILGDDIVRALATLLHEMIHASLEPGVGHKKPFQVICKRVGLLKPWTATEPDGELQKKLRAIALDVEDELGYMPTGVYVPPPVPEKKKSSIVKLVCGCTKGETLSLSRKKYEATRLICGICREPYQALADGERDPNDPLNRD